jgi:acetyl/propionyl-CoA carboxylase alpha subunit
MASRARQEFVLRPVESGDAEIRFTVTSHGHLELSDNEPVALKLLRRDDNGFCTILFGERIVHGFIERRDGDLTLALGALNETFSLRPAALDSMRMNLLAPGGAAAPIEVRSPIPGLVKSVAIELNAAVTAGQTLAILEAMKMENEIRAPHAGEVVVLNVAAGKNVAAGELLLTIKPL